MVFKIYCVFYTTLYLNFKFSLETLDLDFIKYVEIVDSLNKVPLRYLKFSDN